jgi:hypothetical protein
MNIETDDVIQCLGVNNTPLDFVVIDTTDDMALCLPVCEKPNKSLAFWLHKQDIVQELYMTINTFNLKRSVSLHSLLEQQYHAW